jgi:hypothetical protein
MQPPARISCSPPAAFAACAARRRQGRASAELAEGTLDGQGERAKLGEQGAPRRRPLFSTAHMF